MAGVKYIDLARKHAPLATRLHAALDRVLDHGMFVMGPEVDELESRLADYLGVKHVITCGSGTDALVLTLSLRGIGPGDEVITTAHSFIATANAIRLVGATPVFVDIDEGTMCMSSKAAEAAIGERTRAIIPVHINGYPMDTGALEVLCKKNSLSFIEDCAQAFGCRRSGKGVGSTDLGCFSFHPLKIFSALGDGGCITAASKDDAEHLKRLRNHGLADRDHSAEVGFNSRLDSLQAGILLAKLEVVDAYIEARQLRARRYREALAGRVELPPEEAGVRCNYSAFVIRASERDALRASLAEAGVDSKVHYPLAIHQQAAFRALGEISLPVTESLVDRILSLPVSAELSRAQQDEVIDALIAALATREDAPP